MRFVASCLAAGFAALAVAGPVAAVVPEPGDVIVGDSEKSKVFVLDPKTDKRRVLSDDPRMFNPNDSAFSPDGKALYVADYGAFNDEGGVFKINPRTGKTTVLAKQQGFVQPDGIAVAPNGRVYVTDLDATEDDGALFRVNPNTGAVTFVSSADALIDAVGVVVEPDGTPIVTSLTSPIIVRVDPSDGSQETIADDGDGLTGQGGIARASDGTLYIGAGEDALESVDPATAAVDTVANDFFNDGYGLGIDLKDRVLGTNGDNVYRANPADGNVQQVGPDFGYAEGLEVVPRP